MTHDLKKLPRYIDMVSKVFDIENLENQIIDSEYISDYYTESDKGYKYVHSLSGSIHMSLSKNGKFSKQGYYEQLYFIDSLVKNYKASEILELGCGKGFNCNYIASTNPKINVSGIDLTVRNIEQAKEKNVNLKNLTLLLGDFQDLPFMNDKFDLLYEIESVCHAVDMRKVLSEAYRVLSKNGIFILFDGFHINNEYDNNESVKLASRLIEISMAIKMSYEIHDFTKLAKDVGFNILQQNNISDQILPNLFRFQRLANLYLKSPTIAKYLLKRHSELLLRNSIAGLLMPFTVKNGIQGYFQIVLQKVS